MKTLILAAIRCSIIFTAVAALLVAAGRAPRRDISLRSSKRGPTL